MSSNSSLTLVKTMVPAEILWPPIKWPQPDHCCIWYHIKFQLDNCLGINVEGGLLPWRQKPVLYPAVLILAGLWVQTGAGSIASHASFVCPVL